MPEWGWGYGVRGARTPGAGDRSAHLNRAPRPRQHLGIGTMAVVAVGLGAIGFAAFLSVAALFDSGSAHAAPALGRPVTADTVPSGGGAGSTGAKDTEALAQSPLYATGEMSEVECPAPPLDAEDTESMRRFLHTMTDCLDDAWGEQFQRQDIGFDDPTRVFWEASGHSPCGEYPANGSAAFYCPSNKGLYLGVKDIVESSGGVRDPEAYGFLLSHEYGHHVQSEAGVLDSFRRARSEARDNEDRDVLTRRSELQANCLGGAFLGAAERSFPIGAEERENILEDAGRRSDYDPTDREHGSSGNAALWTDHGMDRRDPAACNTWQAGEGLVE